MISMLGSAWSVVVKRLAADWLILTAASTTIVIATLLLATGPIYADAVTVSGVQRILADAEIADANIEISSLLRVENFAAVDQVVGSSVESRLASTGATVNRALVSESYELPSQSSEDLTNLTSFRYIESIEEHASLVQGAWPTSENDATAVSESVAGTLGLSIGDRIEVINRRDRTLVSTVSIVGTYRIVDPTDSFWFNDDLEVTGVERASSFRTVGPLVISRERIDAELSPARWEARWRVFPEFENLTVSAVPRLRSEIDRLRADLDNAGLEGVELSVVTNAPQILSETEQSLLVTRSGVLALTIQLAILAGYALLLTAGLLVDSRRVETSLLRSRGASNNQILAMAIMEGVILTIPAALAAPWLATRLLRVLNDLGPLASIGLTIDPSVTRTSYGLAFLAAAGCIAALAIPAHRAAGSFSDVHLGRSRQGTRSVLQTAGIDLALLLAAGVAFWQLRTFGVQITTRGRGWLEVDPLLIGAPALGLLAGALLALRTVPLLARIAEKAATAGASIVSALSAWQVARRPTRYARSALLLIMAIAIGFFAAAFTTTWGQSQVDQAAYEAGADIRLIPNRRTNDSMEDLHLRQAHSQVAALEASMPVARASGQVARSGGTGKFVLLDASTAGQVADIRDDLSSRDFTDLMGLLAERRPALAAISLPGAPKRIALAFTARTNPDTADRLDGPIGPGIEEINGPAYSPIARVILQDGDGYLHRVTVGSIPLDQGPARIEADLIYGLGPGAMATPTYPLSVVDIEIASPTPSDVEVDATIRFAGVLTSQDSRGNDWQVASDTMTREAWELSNPPVSGVFSFPSIGYTDSQPARAIEFDLSTGLGSGGLILPVYFSVRPAGTELPEVFPVVVTDRLLEEAAITIGEELRLAPLRSVNDTGVIVGTVKEFPTIAPETGEAILLDFPTFQMMTYQPGARIREADEYWIAVADGASEAVTQTLRQPPYESFQIVEQVKVADTLRSDPVALGTIGSLSLGFVAAAVFAAVGFAVSTIVSARERMTEFALLRALGLSPRQLSGWLWLEQGVLVVVSLLLGTLTGALLAWLILPLIAISQEGLIALPDVVVLYPWTTILWLELAVVAALGVIVTVLAVLLRRLGLGSLLRLGED